jgi:anti-sigma-K factor RskA
MQSVIAESALEHQQTGRVARVLAAPDLRSIPLVGALERPDSGGHILWSPSRGWILSASGVPRPAEGQTYQAWVVAGGQPTSVGFLSPDSQGRLAAAFEPPLGELPASAEFVVSLEPSGGSKAPTTAVLTSVPMFRGLRKVGT